MWRDLLRRLGPHRDRRDLSIGPPGKEVWNEAVRSPARSFELLLRIEQAALEVYASHGLPTSQGHYRRGRRARSWTFLGDHLTPEDRWALLIEHPPEQGWRYGLLADIGKTGGPDVRAASALLSECAGLRNGLSAPVGDNLADLLDSAIRLGAGWHALESDRSNIGTSRLGLPARYHGASASSLAKPKRRTKSKPG